MLELVYRVFKYRFILKFIGVDRIKAQNWVALGIALRIKLLGIRKPILGNLLAAVKLY